MIVSVADDFHLIHLFIHRAMYLSDTFGKSNNNIMLGVQGTGC